MKYLRFSITMLSILTLASCSEPEVEAPLEFDSICHTSLAEKDLFTSLAQTSYTFPQPNPEADIPESLQPLLDYVSEAEVVGLGEATHGTSEFFTMKDQLFRGLVTQSGFKGIVFELPWGAAKVIDDYVTFGIGNASVALNQSFYWTYNTDEILQLIEWMRAYNRNRPEADRIRFMGCDPLGPHFRIETQIVSDYLQRVIPDAALEKTAFFSDLPQTNLNEYLLEELFIHQRNSKNIYELLLFMRDNKTEWINKTNTYDYHLAEFAVEVIRQRENVYWFSSFDRRREELMALWTLRWKELMGEGSQVVLWGNNAHILNGWDIRLFRTGTFLDIQIGERYKAVGFSFSSGTFNAFVADYQGGFQAPVRQQAIEEMRCGTANQLLHEVEGDRQYYLMPEQSNSSREFFYSNQSFLQLGPGYNPNFQSQYTIDVPLGAIFDVLIHFDHTSASKLR